MLPERIQVEPNCASEESWVLCDNSHFVSHLGDIDVGDVDPVYRDLTSTNLNDTRQSKGNGGLPSASAANHSNFEARLDLECQVAQNKLSRGSVAK